MFGRPAASPRRDPTRQGNLESEELVQGPGVVGEPGRHGWGAEEPLPRSVVGSEPAQAVVGPAEVVGGADQPHAGGEGRLGASDGATPSGQRREGGAEGGVEALDVGGGDDGAGGGCPQGGPRGDPGPPHEPAGGAPERAPW